MARQFLLRNMLTREKLERLYVRERMSATDIGRYYDVRAATVLNLMEQYDIPRRGPGGSLPSTRERPS